MTRTYESYYERTQKALLKDGNLFAIKLGDIDRARLALICDKQRLTISDAVRLSLRLAVEQLAREG